MVSSEYPPFTSPVVAKWYNAATYILFRALYKITSKIVYAIKKGSKERNIVSGKILVAPAKSKSPSNNRRIIGNPIPTHPVIVSPHLFLNNAADSFIAFKGVLFSKTITGMTKNVAKDQTAPKIEVKKSNLFPIILSISSKTIPTVAENKAHDKICLIFLPAILIASKTEGFPPLRRREAEMIIAEEKNTHIKYINK